MKRILTPLLGLVLFVGLVQSGYALTLTEIRTQVRRNIRDTASATALQRYADAYLTGIVNEGQREIVNETWCVQKKTDLTVTGDVSSALPTDTIAIYRVTYGNSSLPEITLQQQDADTGYTTWTATTGASASYYIQDRTRTSSGQMLLTVYPRPNSSQTLSVWYYANPTDLSADADVPFNAQSWTTGYSDLLVWYASYRVLLIEGMADKASAFKQLYDTGLQRMNASLGVKPQKIPDRPIIEGKP